jgi:hypothetical protein
MLVGHSFEHLGTPDAQVVLRFDQHALPRERAEALVRRLQVFARAVPSHQDKPLALPHDYQYDDAEPFDGSGKNNADCATATANVAE